MCKKIRLSEISFLKKNQFHSLYYNNSCKWLFIQIEFYTDRPALMLICNQLSCPLKTPPLWSFNFWSTRILHWYWFVIGCFVHLRHFLFEVSTFDHKRVITENSSHPKTWGLAYFKPKNYALKKNRFSFLSLLYWLSV